MNRDLRLIIVCVVAFVVCFASLSGFLRAIGVAQ